DDGKVSIGVVNTSQLSGLSALLTVNGKTLIGDPGFLNINTTTSYSLYVQTGILTEKVRVAVANSTSWADYVFAPDYKLLPLEETENFIHTNKHLPGVPSACEVVEKGIDMAEMDATLLKKIEELTLYIIEQDKKIGMLREEIRSIP